MRSVPRFRRRVGRRAADRSARRRPAHSAVEPAGPARRDQLVSGIIEQRVRDELLGRASLSPRIAARTNQPRALSTGASRKKAGRLSAVRRSQLRPAQRLPLRTALSTSPRRTRCGRWSPARRCCFTAPCPRSTSKRCDGGTRSSSPPLYRSTTTATQSRQRTCRPARSAATPPPPTPRSSTSTDSRSTLAELPKVARRHQRVATAADRSEQQLPFDRDRTATRLSRPLSQLRSEDGAAASRVTIQASAAGVCATSVASSSAPERAGSSTRTGRPWPFACHRLSPTPQTNRDSQRWTA